MASRDAVRAWLGWWVVLYGLWLLLAGFALLALAVAAWPLAERGIPAPAARAILPLRRLHSGHSGDYVAWIVAGLTALGGALAVLIR